MAPYCGGALGRATYARTCSDDKTLICKLWYVSGYKNSEQGRNFRELLFHSYGP